VGGFDGGEGGVSAMSGYYFMGTHSYREPADTLLNLNPIPRFVDI
jgi:hypothetical protein